MTVCPASARLWASVRTAVATPLIIGQCWSLAIIIRIGNIIACAHNDIIKHMKFSERSDGTPKIRIFSIVNWLVRHRALFALFLTMWTSAVIHMIITIIKALSSGDATYISMWRVLGVNIVAPPPDDIATEVLIGIIAIAIIWAGYFIVITRDRREH